MSQEAEEIKYYYVTLRDDWMEKLRWLVDNNKISPNRYWAARRVYNRMVVVGDTVQKRDTAMQLSINAFYCFRPATKKEIATAKIKE